MKQYVLIVVLSLLSSLLYAQVETGIEVLRSDRFALLKGKRVGLITNPTGVDRSLKSTIDILFEQKECRLAALYAPEHGVRGDVYAGAKVANSKDRKTGVPVFSIYGKTRKPTAQMLQGVDVLVYDIQDIGCRSYTFISTLGLAMEAAAENGLDFVVLDRPNPLGGVKVEGPLVDRDCRSFVSQYSIPYLYGLTPGELARLINEEGMNSKKCRLTVVPMKGWRRTMLFEATSLPWVLPSPHIPRPYSAVCYPASGILGELNQMSIGVGYTMPFQLFAKDSIDALMLVERMNGLQLPGVRFRPIYFKPFYAFGKDKNLQGIEMVIADLEKVRLTEIQFYVMQEMYRLSPSFNFFARATATQRSMFDKVCGSKQVRSLFSRRFIVEDMLPFWRAQEETFRDRSKKYYLYN